MKRLLTVLMMAFTLAFGGFGAAGCEDDGGLEEAGEKVDEAVKDAGDKIEDAGDEIEDELDNDK